MISKLSVYHRYTLLTYVILKPFITDHWIKLKEAKSKILECQLGLYNLDFSSCWFFSWNPP